MLLSGLKKRELALQARDLVARLAPNADPRNLCLYHAAAIIEVASQELGERFILLAGSAFWPSVSPERDDGVSPNLFGYQWEGGQLDGTLLPEMHVWAGCPATNDYVDLTTRYWPEQCEALTGRRWLAPSPPDFWWAAPERLPHRVTYAPERAAAVVAVEALRKLVAAQAR